MDTAWYIFRSRYKGRSWTLAQTVCVRFDSFEMVTGHREFCGDSAAIVKEATLLQTLPSASKLIPGERWRRRRLSHLAEIGTKIVCDLPLFHGVHNYPDKA
jgi:hypothetical protein